jgi:hypothetical protein
MATNYGFSIAARTIENSRHPGLFISGMSWQAGKFRQIIPVRPGDFVPVWETEQEVVAVIYKFKVSVAGDRFDFEPAEVGTSIQSAGPMKLNHGHFRGVDGFTVPDPPSRIDPGTGRPYR